MSLIGFIATFRPYSPHFIYGCLAETCSPYLIPLRSWTYCTGTRYCFTSWIASCLTKDRSHNEIKPTIAQLGVQYGHMGYYFITVAFMLVTVMLLSCCVPYYVVLLLDVMFVHVLHLSCLVCMYPNCFVAFPLYILVHGCPCFFIISNWTHKPHFWVLMQSSGQFWRWTIEVSN